MVNGQGETESTRSAESIKRSVLELYRSHPFPQWTKDVRARRLAGERCRYEFLGLGDAMRGAKFLDVGCGTGNRSMGAAKFYEVEEFNGFDLSPASLEVARRVAGEDEFDRFRPREGDLLNLPYEDESFDVVVSWGVLHHTSDPRRGFREMVRVCKPGGFLGLFLYNRYADWRHNLQKNKVSRIAGEDVEERFRVAHRLYGTKPANQMTPEEVAVFYDKYCHPQKSDHTLGETLGWFDDAGLEYWGSYLPLRLRDLISCLQYRADLAREHPPEATLSKIALAAATGLPVIPRSQPPFRRPTRFHRFFWEAFWALRGSGGEYSQGAALCARKP